MTHRREAWELELWARGLRQEWWRTAPHLLGQVAGRIVHSTTLAAIHSARHASGSAETLRPHSSPATNRQATTP